MSIYHLKKPFYPESYCLAVDEKKCWSLPSIKCRSCWGFLTNHHLFIRQDLPEGHSLWERKEYHVWPEEFAEIAKETRKALQLSENVVLRPGTEIHRLYLRAACVPNADFEWPDMRCVISERVRQFLTDNNFTGWHAEPVIITKKPAKAALPPLYELVVDGRGGKPLVEPPIKVEFVCEECGAVEYERPAPTRLELVESEWDGSDFFHFDGFFAPYMFISQRLAKALEASSLVNYEIESVEVFLEHIRELNKPGTGGILKDSYMKETMLKKARETFGDDYPEWALLGRRGYASLPDADASSETEIAVDDALSPPTEAADISVGDKSENSQTFVRSCTHNLVFPKKRQAKRVAAFLKDQGLFTEFERVGEYWVVYVAHTVPLDEDLSDSESFKALLEMLDETATAHGGEYIEWMATTTAM
jgi:hypothetical protein